MTPHTSTPSRTDGVRHALSDAADRADRRLAQATHASERAHRQVERSLHQGATQQGMDPQHDRRWAGRMDPLVDRLSSTAQQLARQSKDLASHAGLRAQESWNRYADATTGYVSRQPMRALLMAAAVGAVVTLLMTSRRNRY